MLHSGIILSAATEEYGRHQRDEARDEAGLVTSNRMFVYPPHTGRTAPRG